MAAEQNVTFVYQGTDKKGAKVRGEITARNEALVKTQLRKQGINNPKISKKGRGLAGLLARGGSITPMEVAIFTRQMSTMMKAGVPLLQSFDIVADGLTNPKMKEVIIGIKQHVEGGNSFADALQRYPEYFDNLFVSLVNAGEQAGALETMLDRVAIYKEKSEALKLKIKKAMKYPITILAIATIVTVILLVKVVPTFAELFGSFGAELPMPTQVAINASEWLQAWGIVAALILGGIGYVFSEFKKRSKPFRDWLDKMYLKAPIAGDIIVKATVARYARTLSTTFAAGVPLIESLKSCADAAGNNVYYTAIMRIRDDVATGQQLTFSMRQTGIFPPMAVQMTSIGEESGALDTMLDKVATYYEDEVDAAVDGLTSMMEPAIMAFLGVVVGGLLIAMYMPIFQMGKVVSG
ncbi:MAG: type II secretion system F family protein [Gammaproteobacteria bacterium]